MVASSYRRLRSEATRVPATRPNTDTEALEWAALPAATVAVLEGVLTAPLPDGAVTDAVPRVAPLDWLTATVVCDAVWLKKGTVDVKVARVVRVVELDDSTLTTWVVEVTTTVVEDATLELLELRVDVLKVLEALVIETLVLEVLEVLVVGAAEEVGCTVVVGTAEVLVTTVVLCTGVVLDEDATATDELELISTNTAPLALGDTWAGDLSELTDLSEVVEPEVEPLVSSVGMP